MTPTQIAILTLALFAAFLLFMVLRGRRNSGARPGMSPAEMAAYHERLKAERDAVGAPVIPPVAAKKPDAKK